MGNDSHAFSKIGDCQSVPASFFGIYERPGQYSFSPENLSLQETIDHYNGSFGREGEAVRGGFNTATVLSPMWANTEVCLPGETPIECENREHNPSIVFISLEVWFSGRTPEVYEKYLRRVIDYNLEQGVLPILATKADNVEGDHSINYTIAKLAYEYDLPLWNFWLAVQPMPNHGLDPTDETGFHLNVDGWNVRSFSALKVLDTIMRAMEGSQIGEMTELDITTESNPTVLFTPGPVDSLPYSKVESYFEEGSSTSNIIMGISKRNGEQLKSNGIYQGTLDGTDWQAIAEPGVVLVDQSNNGIIIAKNNDLYLLNTGERRLLSEDLLTISAQPAVWLPTGQVAVILHVEGRNQIAILDLSNDTRILFPSTDLSPVILYPSLDPEHLYWGAGECNVSECIVQDILVSNRDGSETQSLPYVGKPAFASDGKMAFAYQDTNNNQLTLVSGDNSQTLPLFGNRLEDLAWSPDGNTLAVGTALASDYSGRVLESRLTFINWPNIVDTVISITDDTIERAIWSLDGNSVLIVYRSLQDGEYQLDFLILDALKQIASRSGGFRWKSSEYLFPHPIFWMP